MFCIRCGAQNQEAYKFCTTCGQALVHPGSTTHHNMIDSLKEKINHLANTEKLEGFSLGEMFSEVFKRRSPDEIETYFLVGTARSTPRIQEVQTGWPKPWLFVRVLLFVALVYWGFAYAVSLWPQNLNLYPGTIMMGALAVPLATVILFFELNTPRNVSFYRVLMLIASGGIVSMMIALFGFDVSPFDWMGTAQAGIVEEIGKLLAVVVLVRDKKYRFTLNGLLFGAAVGAGFAAFESAGYAFTALWQSHVVQAMSTTILLRAFLAPFGHVAWTAIAAGAFWRVKGANPLRPGMFADPRFWKAFLIPVALHALWDFPYIPGTFFIKYAVIGLVTWYVVFGLVQEGLKQVRAEQRELLEQDLKKTIVLGSLPDLKQAASASLQ